MSELFLAIATLLLAPQSTPPAQEPKPDISETEAIEFARKIERDLLANKAECFDVALDVKGLAAKATQNLPLNPRELSDFEKWVMHECSLGNLLTAESGRSYRFLRLRPGMGPRKVIFRLWSKEGIAYHEWKLRRSPGGEIRIEDLYIYFNGDWLVPTLRRAAVALMASEHKRWHLLKGLQAELATHHATIQELEQESMKGSPEKALKLYKSLPESVQRDRLVQIKRLRAAGRSEGDDFPGAEVEFAKLFPGDIYKDFVGIDAHFKKKRYDQALAALNALEKFLGGDPAFDSQRAGLFLTMGRLPEAKEAAAKAARGVPYVQTPRWQLVSVSLREKAHLDTIGLLTDLERDFNLTVGNLEALPDYAEFVKSPEYREWMKSRGGK